jgi:C-terminal processing protease CtpA/Prc
LHEWDPQKNGCQVFAIIGKKTGSSAILNSMQLKRELGAIFIGKPTGGKPNHYGDVKYFGLPNSEISIQYSTKYFKVSEKNQLSIIPDIRVKDVSKDYFAGKDPVMKTILSY